MLDIFEEFATKMAETNSRLDKEDILKQYSDYEEVRYVLNFIYNPYITTGISAKKIKKAEKMSGETDAQIRRWSRRRTNGSTNSPPPNSQMATSIPSIP